MLWYGDWLRAKPTAFAPEPEQSALEIEQAEETDRQEIDYMLRSGALRAPSQR